MVSSVIHIKTNFTFEWNETKSAKTFLTEWLADDQVFWWAWLAWPWCWWPPVGSLCIPTPTGHSHQIKEVWWPSGQCPRFQTARPRFDNHFLFNRIETLFLSVVHFFWRRVPSRGLLGTVLFIFSLFLCVRWDLLKFTPLFSISLLKFVLLKTIVSLYCTQSLFTHQRFCQHILYIRPIIFVELCCSTVHSSLYTVHCTLYTVHCTLLLLFLFYIQ